MSCSEENGQQKVSPSSDLTHMLLKPWETRSGAN
ncbi:hypothetical protein R3I94_007565 [Phoxinus phoxinus]